ncbi:hypothetical protein QUA44_08205 [Microcoleus sp. N9_A2]
MGIKGDRPFYEKRAIDLSDSGGRAIWLIKQASQNQEIIVIRR